MEVALKLTGDDEVAQAARRTPPGMAHFIGTGPKDAICRTCNFWVFSDYYSKAGKHGGYLKPGPCRKYKALMGGKMGPPVPGNTAACRHYEQNPKPPTPQKSWEPKPQFERLEPPRMP